MARFFRIDFPVKLCLLTVYGRFIVTLEFGGYKIANMPILALLHRSIGSGMTRPEGKGTVLAGP